ncbi:hypothetical protein BRE01_48130 [Brevibacillus reuszeri]|uniref:Uncharacterized protein n=1 Tax=Brevibacillus reuszeri TaxID=54915 RepID=A0A0K9Z021_9BACL|nr:hypothetical protein [Brevibacillus reuszeri]KNB73820.1 hypothetical protein ADS79_07780 [Brevibacillus reuszeri]MED1860035.1 hypothetical protein [Brevibacillus reuszeri]GED71111.1 hypothetical protein BRE01_48130 [Brevibacillus reuszeri]
MDVEVYYSGQRGGTMPYAALPAFRLFCKQNGFQLKWDPKNKRIDLDSGLKGKVCVLFTGKSTTETPYEWDVLGRVQKFVADYGMEVVLAQNNLALAKNTDIAIRFSIKELRLLEKPRLVLFQTEDEKRRELIRCLQAELKQTGIPCHIKAGKEGKPTSSIVHLQLQIPKHTEIFKRKAYGEKIAFYLASGILGYLQVGMQIQPLAYLPPNLLKVFFGSVLANTSFTNELTTQEVQSAEPVASEEEYGQEAFNELGLLEADEQLIELEAEIAEEFAEEEEEDANHDTELHADKSPDQTLTHEKERTEEPEVRSVGALPQEPSQTVLAVETIEAETEAAETVASPDQSRQPEWIQPSESRTEAEVFFDYTLIHSDSNEKPYLLIGTLQVKNTGTEELFNPIVCLRVTPADSIKMGGQILPPKLVETMAVQGMNGLKGWRYLEDDWFAQAMERGEYWIAPIAPVSIAPKATESFQNFQISFLRQDSGKSVIVEGVVVCNNQEIHFPANNRIAVSF